MFNLTDIVCENICTYRYSIGAVASVLQIRGWFSYHPTRQDVRDKWI